MRYCRDALDYRRRLVWRFLLWQRLVRRLPPFFIIGLVLVRFNVLDGVVPIVNGAMCPGPIVNSFIGAAAAFIDGAAAASGSGTVLARLDALLSSIRATRLATL
jgi:hypothetical protein